MERKTKESDIVVELDLDGTGVVSVETGVPFFDHMLTSLGTHASFDLTVKAVGDIEIEGHHTIEDTAIVLGQALAQAAHQQVDGAVEHVGLAALGQVEQLFAAQHPLRMVEEHRAAG